MNVENFKKAEVLYARMNCISGVINVLDRCINNGGLHFWIPEGEEDDNAERLIHTEEFMNNEYYPSKSVGLRIDVIVP